jgi:hypothetical protein
LLNHGLQMNNLKLNCLLILNLNYRNYNFKKNNCIYVTMSFRGRTKYHLIFYNRFISVTSITKYSLQNDK